MTDTITLTGLVATTPRHVVTTEGLTIASFRLASAQRRFDRSQERWVDIDTNWYTITAFRQLAVNCAGSVNKGDRVVVTGRLRIREWQNGERAGTTVDIEADAVGHDLSWGTSSFSRTISSGSKSTTGGPDEQSWSKGAGELGAHEPSAHDSADSDSSMALTESDEEKVATPF